MEQNGFSLKIPADTSEGEDATILRQIALFGGFDSQSTFNAFCRHVIEVWAQAHTSRPSGLKQFDSLLHEIEMGTDRTIPTSWGGVVVTSHEHPNVEKFLVVRRGRYLAFEKHEQKIETLAVSEGQGILLYRGSDEHLLEITILRKGFGITLHPGEEHCIIGTEDLVVFESSVDPKGMDKDLIFLFTPEPE